MKFNPLIDIQNGGIFARCFKNYKYLEISSWKVIFIL